MKTINEAMLTKFNACSEGVKWFNRNIGELDVELLKDIEGDYRNYVSWIRELFEDKTYDKSGNRLIYEDLEDLDGLETWTYDDSGNCLTHEDLDGLETWTYDKSGNRLTYENSNGFSSTKTYDESGNCLTHKNSNGFSTTETYDESGNRLTYENSKGLSEARTYLNDGEYFTQTLDGEIEIRIKLK